MMWHCLQYFYIILVPEILVKAEIYQNDIKQNILKDIHNNSNYESNGEMEINRHNAHVVENRLAIQLYSIIEHYKQNDPVGFPGVPIPDPMSVPDMRKSLGMATLNMMSVQAYGLSKFRITNIKADLEILKVEGIILLDEMIINGSYTLNSIFGRTSGPFTVGLKQVIVKASGSLGVQRDGHLTTERINMDITFADMTMDFQKLGFLGSIFQNIVNSAPNLVFDAMKPFMLQEADKKLRKEINVNIEKLMGDRLLSNSITPLDMAIAEGRRRIREMNYDPYHMPDYNRTMGVFSVQLTNTWVNGIASFYRVGDITVSMENNTVTLKLHVGTQEISGASQWEIGCGLITRIGHVQFIVEHIHLTVNISQALDIRKKPHINDLQIDLGNIQIRCDGAGTWDYIMEFVVNVLPNLLRYQIIDALENPIKMRIQEQLNIIDVEQAIKDNFDKFQTTGSLDFSFNFI